MKDYAKKIKTDLKQFQTSSLKKNNTPSLNACRFCNKEYHVNKLPKHEIWCEENPNLEYVKEFYASGKKNHNQYIKAKMLGLPKPEMT